MNYQYTRLTPTDIEKHRQLMQIFAAEFESPETYMQNPPSDSYINNYLSNKSNLMLVADLDGKVVGGLSAYLLEKPEQQRTELFVYDLAISATHHRKGLATGLFNWLIDFARSEGIYQIFVEADDGDDRAISFYESLNSEREVAIQFTISPH